MLSTLLATLPIDFYICFSSGGEDGKKIYASCVKRLKSELSNIKSVYGNEIRQLFPLTPKPCEVITVRTPMPQAKGSPQSERVKVSNALYLCFHYLHLPVPSTIADINMCLYYSM